MFTVNLTKKSNVQTVILVELVSLSRVLPKNLQGLWYRIGAGDEDNIH